MQKGKTLQKDVYVLPFSQLYVNVNFDPVIVYMESCSIQLYKEPIRTFGVNDILAALDIGDGIINIVINRI